MSISRYRDVLVSDSRGFWFGRGHIRQVLDHFLGIFRLAGAGLSRAQDGLVLAICRDTSRKMNTLAGQACLACPTRLHGQFPHETRF